MTRWTRDLEAGRGHDESGIQCEQSRIPIKGCIHPGFWLDDAHLQQPLKARRGTPACDGRLHLGWQLKGLDTRIRSSQGDGREGSGQTNSTPEQCCLVPRLPLQPRIIQAAPKTRYMVGQSRRPDKPTTMGWFNHCHLIGTLWAMGYRATYYINFSLSCAYESSQTITTKGYCHIMAQTTRTSRAVRDRAPRAAI